MALRVAALALVLSAGAAQRQQEALAPDVAQGLRGGARSHRFLESEASSGWKKVPAGRYTVDGINPVEVVKGPTNGKQGVFNSWRRRVIHLFRVGEYEREHFLEVAWREGTVDSEFTEFKASARVDGKPVMCSEVRNPEGGWGGLRRGRAVRP